MSFELNKYNFTFKKSPVAELEQSYRDIIIFPLLKTCINMVNNDRLLFISGEVPLGSKTTQLINTKKKEVLCAK